MEIGPGTRATRYSTDGWCSLGAGPDVQGVTVWHEPLSEADRERLAAVGQDADSERGSSRSGQEEPSDVTGPCGLRRAVAGPLGGQSYANYGTSR